MSRTVTKDLSSLSAPDVSFTNTATFEFQTDATGNYRLIKIPPGSKWRVPLHWHERYTETFLVISGRVLLTVNGKARVITPADGEQSIEPFIQHGFSRADIDVERDEGDVVVREGVEPGEIYDRTSLKLID